MVLVFPVCSMFLSRTVAAEICMEAKTNEPAYTALKRLDKEGVLRFELAYVIGPLLMWPLTRANPFLQVGRRRTCKGGYMRPPNLRMCHPTDRERSSS